MFGSKDKTNQPATTDLASTPRPAVAAPTAAKAPAPQVARRVRLGDIDRTDDRFFLRDKSARAEGSLKGLMDAIQHEGLQDPIEVATLDGRVVLVKGFLRVEACVLLGRKQLPGFGDDMELDAIEVHESDPNELLIRSVLDNSHRRNLDQVERIGAARRLFLAGVVEARAAEALGVSPQSYKRDLAIAESPWMFRHVVNSEVSPTPASTLLRAIAEAEKEHPGIGAQFRAELADWIEKKKAEIDRRDRIAKAKKGKGQGISAAEKKVSKYLTSQIAEHWAILIGQGLSLDEEAEWTFKADLDPKKEVLQIGGARLNLATDSVAKLAEVASKLSQLAKELGPVLQRRHAEDLLGRPGGRGIVRDTGYL